MHAVRDSGGTGRRVRGLSRAGLLLRGESGKRRGKGGRSEEERQRRRSSPSSLPSASSLLSPLSDWWSTYFDDRYLIEHEPLFDLERDRRDVGRLIEILELPVGARILDCPCGQGRHAHLLAEAGYDVDGVDYSRELLARARRRGEGEQLRYTRADMRALPERWTGRFDAVINLFTSFGFFAQPQDDQQVIREFARVLKPGAVLVWHGASRDGVSARFLSRDWWRTSNGTLVVQQRSFDPLSGFLTVESEHRGRKGGETRTHRIRLYTATRLAELCRDAGLIVEEAHDGWRPRRLRRASSEMLLVARKDR